MDPEKQYPEPATVQVNHPLAVMQSGEKVVCEIKRHPIGMIGLYLGVGLLVLALAVICLVVLPNSSANAQAIGAVIFIVLSALMLGFVFIANIIYWGNRWVVTSDSVTQYSQTGLFQKQSTQLSFGNLQDISVEQNGILTHIFNYGTLKAETAGERSKFFFLYCPNPNLYAQQILGARETYLQTHTGDQPMLTTRIPGPIPEPQHNNSEPNQPETVLNDPYAQVPPGAYRPDPAAQAAQQEAQAPVENDQTQHPW